MTSPSSIGTAATVIIATAATPPDAPPDAAPDSSPEPNRPAVTIGPDFVAAGHAIFTVANGKGQHYTYRVVNSKSSAKNPKSAWWVSFLTGPDNEHDYTYIGRYYPQNGGGFTLTTASNLPSESLPVRVFVWAIAVIHGRKKPPEGYAIHHEGACGRCGRRLTNPASIDSGIGPECAKLLDACVR